MNGRVRGLLPETHVLLSRYLKFRDRPLKDIADGAGLGVEWLRKFKARSTHDFGVKKVQTLHNYLLRRLRNLEKRRYRFEQASWQAAAIVKNPRSRRRAKKKERSHHQ